MWSGEMKRCELCRGKARMYCESDQASLCWDCDAKVHSANFLVARHSRNLLCRVCQGPTPWSASGAKLGPTASVCEQCVDGKTGGEESEEQEEEQEVVEENQVAPWSPPQPSVESSSSIDEAVSGGEAMVSGKRFRTYKASRNLRSDEDESSSAPLRKIQRMGSGRVGARGSRNSDSLGKSHREESGSGGERVKFYSFL